MAIKGSLKEASLADVCQLLSMGLKTGCLSVTDRSKFGQIFFEKGRITYATVVNRRDRLGDLLVTDEVITHDQLQQAVEAQAHEPDMRLGEILVERGLIDKEHVARYIRLQIEEAVYHLFTWVQGAFYFEVDQLPEEVEFRVSINPESLLLEGARRVDEWSVIEKKIPSLDLIFELDRERLHASDAELTAEQERILPLLDGTATVQDVADSSGLVEFDVGKGLYGLIQAGFVHRVGKRAPLETGRVRESNVNEHLNLGIAFYQTGMFDDAAREFRKVLELRPLDGSARHHLALLALRQGKLREGVQRFKQIMEDSGPSHAAFVNLGYALVRLERFEDALLVLEEAESLRPDSTAVPLLRADIRARLGELEASASELDSYRARLGEETAAPPYYHLAALGAAVRGDLERAERLAAEGLEHYGGSAPLLLTAGLIAERRGRFAEAEQHYRQALEEDPALPQIHKNLGDLAYRGGLHDDAAEHYMRVLKLEPEIGDDVYARLGNIHYKRFERDAALELWRRALELNPANQVVRNNLEVVENAIG